MRRLLIRNLPPCSKKAKWIKWSWTRPRTKSLLSPKILRRADGSVNFSSTRSNYTENFLPDFHKQIKPTHAIDPARNGVPFSKFPYVPEQKVTFTMDQMTQQTRLNKDLGKKNRAIFTSKTIL